MDKKEVLEKLMELSDKWYADYEKSVEFETDMSAHSQRCLGHSRGYMGAIKIVEQLKEQ